MTSMPAHTVYFLELHVLNTDIFCVLISLSKKSVHHHAPNNISIIVLLKYKIQTRKILDFFGVYGQSPLASLFSIPNQSTLDSFHLTLEIHLVFLLNQWKKNEI